MFRPRGLTYGWAMRTPVLSVNRRTRPASVVPQASAPGDNFRAAMLMCSSMALFTTNDTVMKFVAQTLPLYQSITLRGLVIVAVLVIYAWRRGRLRLWVPRGDIRQLILRTIGEIGSTILFLNALQHMPLGNLSAIMQSLPLVVMLTAAVVFRERLGWRRLVAVLVGLIGVMMILQPGRAAFDLWAVLALGSVALVVLRDMATRMFSAEVASSTIALYAALSVTISAFVLSLGQGWQMPDAGQAGLLVLAGLLLCGGYITGVATMRIGEISFVAPFRYVSLVVAVLLGLIVFREWPDGWTWAGSALVVGAGIYSIWREAALRRGA